MHIGNFKKSCPDSVPSSQLPFEYANFLQLIIAPQDGHCMQNQYRESYTLWQILKINVHYCLISTFLWSILSPALTPLFSFNPSQYMSFSINICKSDYGEDESLKYYVKSSTTCVRYRIGHVHLLQWFIWEYKAVFQPSKR